MEGCPLFPNLLFTRLPCLSHRDLIQVGWNFTSLWLTVVALDKEVIVVVDSQRKRERKKPFKYDF